MSDTKILLLKLDELGIRINKLEGKSFDNLQKILINQEVYNTMNSFLKSINCKIDSTLFLTSFAMKFYMNYMVDNVETVENKEISKLIDFTLKLYDNLFTYDKELIDNFSKYLLVFNEKISIWKKNDLLRVIEEYSKMFWSLETHKKIKGISEKQIEELCSKQKTIKETIRTIGGNEGIEIFNKYSPVFFDDTAIDNLKSQIEKTYKKIYWDKLIEDLNNKSFNSIILILDEIRQRIALLTPNRIDMHKLLEEYIDTELIKQMLENNAVDDNYFYRLSYYIVERLKELEAPVDNQSTKEWQDEIDEIFKSKIIMSEYFPTFFQKVFSKLEKIEHETKIFRDSEIFKEIERQKKNQ